MSRVRTFIAVDVGESIIEKAVALQTQLARCGAEVKWVNAEAMHVTLLFLGEVEDRDLVRVCRAVQRAASRMPEFSLRVGGVGAFPNPRRPKVVWAGITEGADQLRELFKLIEEPMLEMGVYRQEERDYTPHLTLGRMRGDADGQLIAPELPKHLAWDAGRTIVSEVLVMSSDLRKDGPEYVVMGRSKLTPGEV